MITIWQVASLPFWAIAIFQFINGLLALTAMKVGHAKFVERMCAAGICGYIAARMAT